MKENWVKLLNDYLRNGGDFLTEYISGNSTLESKLLNALSTRKTHIDLCEFIKENYGEIAAKTLAWYSLDALRSYYKAGKNSVNKSNLYIGWIMEWYDKLEQLKTGDVDDVFIPLRNTSPTSIELEQLKNVILLWNKYIPSGNTILNPESWPDADYFSVLYYIMNLGNNNDLIQQIMSTYSDKACESLAYLLVMYIRRPEVLQQTKWQWQTLSVKPMALDKTHETIGFVSANKISTIESAFSILFSLELQKQYSSQFHSIATVEWDTTKEVRDSTGRTYIQMFDLPKGRGLTQKQYYTFHSIFMPALPDSTKTLMIFLRDIHVNVKGLPTSDSSMYASLEILDTVKVDDVELIINLNR